MINSKSIKLLFVIILLLPWLYVVDEADSSDYSMTNTADIDKKNPIQKSAHHTEFGFQNHPFIPTAAPKGATFYLRRFWHSISLPDVPATHSLSQQLALEQWQNTKGSRITWLGHASFLIQINGQTILTDPFLSEFASPLSWAGPRRFVEPGLAFDNLPQIDIIIVSHNHYDHLDDWTVRSLSSKQQIHVFVPLGLKEFFQERGYSQVTELDWYQQAKLDNLKFTALPAVHDSARSTSDHNQTLWASWLIQTLQLKVYFVGDSAYTKSLYTSIGERFGPFDYVFVPIGAYEPRELMWMSHMTPEEAVSLGRDLKANRLIASHWGTINLSDEPTWEPPNRFRVAGENQGFNKDRLWIMKIGETRELR